MSTTLKVLSAKKVIASHQINQGDTLVIDARDKSNYQLIDDQTGFGPQNIIAKREGKDLKIFLEDGDMNPDVLIKGYYGDENSEEVTNLIVGQHENGGIYAYVPESGLKSDAVSMLAEEVAAPQALGGEELASAFWAFNPWWLLALVPLAAGIAIAASSGGSNGDSNNGNADNTADKPTLDAKSDGSVTVAPGADNTKVVVKYTDESGNKKAATLTKDANGNWSSDNPDVTPNANGTFSIPANKVKDGSKVTATGTDDKGNTANVDATAANNPTTSRVPGDVDGNGNADANDNDATTENGGPKVSVPEAADGVDKTEASDGVQVNVTLPKNTKAGDTVTVTVTKPDGSTVTVDHVVTDADETAGKAAVTIPTTEITADGDYKVVAKVTTPDGQESKPSAEVPFTFDQTPPATPDVQAPADGSITVEPKDENPVTIKYTDENGNEKEFTVKKDDNGNWVSDDKPANVSIDSNTGKTTIPATEVKDGEKVTATAKDPAGNTAEKTADAGNNPTTPRVPGDVDGDGDADANDNDATTENGGPKVSVPEAADGVNKTEASDGVQVNVTLPKNTKAGDTVTLTVTKPDGSTVTVDHVVTDADETAGKAAVTIPTTEITADGDYKVVAKVTTPDGQESKPSAEVPFTFDQTPPATPDVQAPADGSMTVEPKDENPVTIKYTDENGNEKEFTVKKDDNDNWVSDDKPANVSIDPNTGKTTIPATEVKDGEKVTATAKDPAGNTAEKTADAGNNPTTPRISGDVDGDGDADADDNDATTEKGGPKVTIPEAENSVNAEEAKDGVQVDVTLPKNTKEGDTVKLSVIKPNGQQFEIDYTVNKADETSNKATVTIPALDVGIDGNYDVAARVVTPDGQESRVSDSVPFTVDNGADQPTITSANNDGKVIVEPGEDNNKVEIKFKDEDGNDKTVVAEKGADGNWTVTADDGTGATIENGKVLIPSDKVKDGEPVNATGTDASGNTADADTVNAGTNPTVNNTADKPLITPENDGSVTVKPGDDNVGVVVDFKDEKNQPQQVSAKKDDSGKWIISNNSGVDGAEVDPDTGIITIPAEALKDNEPVNAVGFDEIFNRANADPKNAGTDPKNAGVDNTNGDGVVSAPVSADEGTSIVTTVKLNNNNGNEKLPFSLPSGTGNGQLTADDFEQPTFSNGVTLNSDGTLNIPAGVKEFTITTPVKADNTTEGEEKGKFTVGGVEGNEVTVNDTSATPADPADKPTITSPDNDGKVTVEPGADNNKVEATFKDEDGNDKTVVAEKGQDGNWTITNDDGTGATIEGGKVVIPADKVKDGEPVNAKGTNDAGNSENADAVNAGTDPKDAGVDNTNGDGVVSAPVSADEGTSIVTTVKLNNNNGNEKLPFSLPSGTGNGQLTADDFEQPTFSNGVTLNSDGTLNIPAGVKEFTITTPVKADNTTEGEEKGKFTVGGVEGNEVTVNDTSATPADPADKPTITSPDNDGKVTVEPGADNNKVEVTFKDEDGNDKTVVAEKGQDGNWTITNDDGTGATIEGGKVVIPADKVKDGEPVNAKGTNDAGNSENADAVNAGTDPKDAGVNNTNGDGVVSAPVSADEGTNIVTTVKLNNNNGNEKLPFSLPSGTGNGQLTADDFEQPTFSNGVTLNSDGTLNIPAGVKEFTITTPVKADNTTEGEEKGKFTVGGVEGNEVTVNDTSKQDEQPKIDINNIAGQAQVAEGTEGYAQFLPSNIATEEISNTTENGVTKVVKGFVVKGTTTSIPADSEVDVTITANGENYFTGKAKVGADGAWEIKVPTSTVTTTVTGSGEDEVTEVVTEFNNPKFDVSYDVTAKVTVNGQEITDTDKTESAPVVTDIYLQDNLTDDAQNVADFYTDNGEYVGRIDGMADSDATKAISRQTGLTNDPSAELHFTLDKEPKAGQVVKVLRYTIVDGNEGRVEDLTDQMTNNGLNYTVKPTTPQAETTNTLYRYKVVVEDQNGTDLSEKVFNYRLDTIVESMDVKELNSDTNTMVLKADGVSEIGATIKYKYHTGSGESALKDAVDNGDGTYTIDLANWNRKVPQSITLQVIDAAGNVSETKINAVRNLFTSYTAEEGPDPNGTRFDRQLVTGFAQSSTRAENGAFVSTDGNDTLIVGLDNFGGMGVSNGSVGRNINVGSKIHIEMGKGDDHIQVRGSVQSMGSATDGYFDMGEGNDKLTFAETFVVGNYNIRMGEGNNTINFSGTTVQAAGLDISYGDGNDVLRADVNKDFAGTKTISFGNGDNYMEVGSMYDKNTITFGNGNDVFIAKSVGTKAPSSGVIDMGDGNDTFSVSGLFARQEAKLGAGDDVAIMGDRIETGAAWARLDGGDGNDTLVLTKSDGKVSLQNVLNFEVIDLTTPTAQTIGISNSYITQANDTTKAIYIKGGTNDTVDFGDNGKYINGTKFKDGGGAIKSNWNFWEKTESDVVHDGITYDKYTHRTASGEVNDEAIYIQQGVQII
uniref:Uncharacterized protein pnxIIIA n=1 Tax=Rodentibacter pneumotropicus TaxID=758 RepID=D6RVY9_9PAST|nr:hypothetical protein [[Pasteurella] pneumotropica] [Rodentibacter pneumotropicus]